MTLVGSVMPTGEVHPVAALFPMMSDEELDDLAADIEANGLLHPILLNSAGVLIDGRNRLAACNRVAYPPRFETFDGEPAALIISANVTRRHLSLGQRAMAVVQAKLVLSTNFAYGWQAEEVGRVDPAERVSMQALLVRAYAITKHAPDLVDVVMAGGSLNQAYAEALRRKRLPEEQAEQLAHECDHAGALLQLRADFPSPLATARNDGGNRARQGGGVNPVVLVISSVVWLVVFSVLAALIRRRRDYYR